MKKGALLTLMISTILLLTSCGLDYRYSLDENLHNQIECVMIENEPSYITYRGDNYIFAGTTNFFHVDTYEVDTNYYKSYEDDILLSWNGNRYVGYIDEYYSYTSECPKFIYNERLGWVYLHEDYDYAEDIFAIENTSIEIIWEDIFDSEHSEINFTDPVTVVLYAKQLPRIKTTLEIECIEHQWYLSLPDTQTVWRASDAFIKLLSENGIIFP